MLHDAALSTPVAGRPTRPRGSTAWRRVPAWPALVALLIALAGMPRGVPAQERRRSGPNTTLTMTVSTDHRHPISRYIYGVNFAERGGSPAGTAPWFGAVLPPGITLSRFGGNRLSAFNWVTGASNVGRDGQGTWSNDRYLVNSGNGAWDHGASPGSAVAARIATAGQRAEAIIVTVPMLDYVARDVSGPLDTTEARRAARLSSHFARNHSTKGAPFTLTPDPGKGAVYQDEFVNFLKARFPNRWRDSVSPVFFGLDNEPDLWTETHAETVNHLWTYAEFTDTSVAYARAIKSVIPSARVFGPSVATYTGVVAGDRYRHGWIDDPQYGRQNFFDVYLDRMRAAEKAGGRRLLDVLDLHFYPAVGTSAGEIGNDYARQDAAMVDARLQAPRSLWDPTYLEASWVTRVTGSPLRLIPRLREQIARHYPGTQLAITEYYYGRGGDISGGIAQADVLGIFGREGLFAAALWPNAGVYAPPYGGNGKKAYAYLFAAFRLFRDYDGAGGRFGDTGVSASVSDDARSSVYASLDEHGRVTIIALNKDQAAAAPVTLVVEHPRPLGTIISVHQLTGASPDIVKAPAGSILPSGYASRRNRYTFTMPALSATVIVLGP